MILIDKDKTLKEMWYRLWKLEDKIEEEHGLDLIERFNIQRGFEEGLQTVVEQPTAYEWISVSKRLPEGEYDNYIVYTDDDRVCEYDIGSWGNGDWSGCNADGFVPHINVIAWMPFPEYKEEVK